MSVANKGKDTVFFTDDDLDHVWTGPWTVSMWVKSSNFRDNNNHTYQYLFDTHPPGTVYPPDNWNAWPGLAASDIWSVTYAMITRIQGNSYDPENGVFDRLTIGSTNYRNGETVYNRYTTQFLLPSATDDTNWHHYLISVDHDNTMSTHGEHGVPISEAYVDGTTLTHSYSSSSPTTSPGYDISDYNGGPPDYNTNWTSPGIGEIAVFGGHSNPMSYGGVHTLSGQLDDISIWSKAMNSTEAAAIYNNGVPGNIASTDDDLEAWWMMGESLNGGDGEGNYTSIADSSDPTDGSYDLYEKTASGGDSSTIDSNTSANTTVYSRIDFDITLYPSVSAVPNLYILGTGFDTSNTESISISSLKAFEYNDNTSYNWTASAYTDTFGYKLQYNGNGIWFIYNTETSGDDEALWELKQSNRDASYTIYHPNGLYTPVSNTDASQNLYVTHELGKLTRNYTTDILRTWYKERRKRKNPSKVLKTNDTEYGSITGHWYLSGSDTGYTGKWYNNVTDVDNPSDGWLLQYSPSISTWTITSFVNDTVYYRGYPCDEDDGTKDVAHNPVTGKWRGMHQGPCGDRPRGVYYSIYSGASGRVRLHDEYPKPSVFWSTHKSQTWSDENDDDIIDDEELDDTGAIGNLMKTYTLASTSVMISSTDVCGENFNIVSEGSLKSQRDEGRSYTTAKQSTERTIVPAFGTGIRNTKHLPFTSDVDDMLDDVDDRRIKGEDGDSPSNTSNADGSSGDITSGLKKRSTLIVSESSRNHLYFHTTDQTQKYPDYPFIIKGSLKTDGIFQTYTSQHTGILETIFFKTSGCFTAGLTLTAHKGQFEADDMTSFTSDQKLTEVTVLTSDTQPYGKIEVHLNIPVEQGAQYIFEIGGDTELVDNLGNTYPLHMYAMESTGISATDSGTLSPASLLPYSCGYIGTSNWPTSIASNEAWLQPGAEVTSTSIDYMWTGLWFEAKVYDTVEEKTAICTYNGWRWDRMHVVWNTEYREYEDIGPK